MRRKCLWTIVAPLLLTLVIVASAHAAPVGRFTMVTGQVDLLRQGKLPAAPVKVQDGVESGDVVRTKSRSKATIQFVDDTTLTLAPESRIAVADYLFDPAQGTRRAVLRVFRGLVHTVVTRILNLQEPDFIMQTFTAVTGVRGTEWYTLLKPDASVFYLVKGLLQVGSSNLALPTLVLLKDMQLTQVLLSQPPRPARAVTPADLRMLQHLMDTGVPDSAYFEPPPGENLPQTPARLPGTPDDTLQPYISPTLRGPAGSRNQ